MGYLKEYKHFKSNTKRELKTVSFTIISEFRGLTQTQGEENLCAYLFDLSGRLLEKQPMVFERDGIGKALFKKLPVDAKQAVVKIGPDVENIRILGKYHPVTDRFDITPNRSAAFGFEIPKVLWNCWIKNEIEVSGTISSSSLPWSDAEIDIYDVDIHYCFTKLPDLLIERIREALIDLMIDPLSKSEQAKVFPQWIYMEDDFVDIREVSDSKINCAAIHDTKTRPMDDIAIALKLATLPEDLQFAYRRFNKLSDVNRKKDKVMGGMSLLETGNWLNTEVIEGIKMSSILLTETPEFRQLLINNFKTFSASICKYPWIYWMWWPYCRCYSLEHLGTARVNSDGCYSHNIRFSRCMKDRPDLWFVVRNHVNGREQVVYNPFPVYCHTIWQYSGKEPVELETVNREHETRPFRSPGHRKGRGSKPFYFDFFRYNKRIQTRSNY